MDGSISLSVKSGDVIPLNVVVQKIALNVTLQQLKLTVVPSPIKLTVTPKPIKLNFASTVQGRPGRDGNSGGGGQAFVFTQSVPSLAWIVFHDMGTKPQITVIDANGVEQFCRKTFPNDQSALLEFNSPMSGQAYCLG